MNGRAGAATTPEAAGFRFVYRAPRLLAVTLPLWLLLSAQLARSQGIDLTQGGPIQITSRDGLEWRQTEQVVIAHGDAKAVRGNVTVTADRLYAWYRRKGGDTAPQPVATGVPGPDDTEGNEVYRMRAEGNVHIYTQTDQAWGDQATYDLDQAVMVMTGHALKLTTPSDTVTARDTLEYWSQKHMAVARGNAVVVTNDARRISADTLVAYTVDASSPATPAGATQAAPAKNVENDGARGGQSSTKAGGDSTPAMAGKLQRVEAFNKVTVRTVTDIITGDRGVYVADTDIAHLGGHVRITRGANQVNGSEAVVNMKTGIATLLAGGGGRVTGLVVPNDQSGPPDAADTTHKPPQGQSKPEGKP
jgi:lipopolysaccharide export system protein LptA